MEMKKRIVFNAMLLAGILSSSVASATTGYFAEGYGVKAKGMAGVGIAFPLDALAAATNPAGMVMVGSRLDLGLEWFKPDRGAEVVGNTTAGANGNYDANGKSNFFIPSFGYNKMVDADTSFGVSVYGNGGMNTTFAVKNNLLGSVPAQVNLEQLFVAPTWSRKLDASNAIGVSLNLAYQKFSATGLENFRASSIAAGSVTDNGNDTSIGYGLHIGWIGQVSPAVTLGATYQTKTRMGKLSKYSGLFAGQGSFDIPATYGVGIAVKAAPATTVAFDIQRIMYGDVPAIANPNNILTGAQLGQDNGPGFGWTNMTVYKLGISHQYDANLTLRAGWSHNNDPIPATQTYFNMIAPGVVKDNVGLGATWKLADKSEVSVFYSHAFKTTLNGQSSLAQGGQNGEANLYLTEDSLGIAYGW